MTDHLNRAAEVIAAQMHGLTTPSMCRGIARALEDAGLLASPERDAAVAAKALRIVETVCMTTDGDHLDGESEIPAGEVMRMILEVERSFGIEREAGGSE